MNTIPVPPVIRTYHAVRPKIDVLYPDVEGLANPQVQYSVNRAVIGLLNDTIAQQNTQPGTDITAGYELKTNERGILSLTVIVYSFSGGAHGLTVKKSVTIDTGSGRLYKLAELFKPHSAYASRLNSLIREQIRVRNMPLIAEFNGVTADQDFYVADKALVVYFQLYALTPYVYGFPCFPIPVYQIEDIVLEDGPLGRMIS